jgi:hypothetical protein
MIVVMMFGMCVLGAAFGAFHELAFGSGFAPPGAITSCWPPLRWRST